VAEEKHLLGLPNLFSHPSSISHAEATHLVRNNGAQN
jgi:hypothetical protein